MNLRFIKSRKATIDSSVVEDLYLVQMQVYIMINLPQKMSWSMGWELRSNSAKHACYIAHQHALIALYVITVLIVLTTIAHGFGKCFLFFFKIFFYCKTLSLKHPIIFVHHPHISKLNSNKFNFQIQFLKLSNFK